MAASGNLKAVSGGGARAAGRRFHANECALTAPGGRRGAGGDRGGRSAAFLLPAP